LEKGSEGVKQSTRKVFVYGTLKPRGRYHRVAKEAGAFTFEKAYLENFVIYDLEPENYPAVTPGDGVVHGYVFEYENIDTALVILDRLEAIHDNPPEYKREQAIAQPMNETVWVYVYARTERLKTAKRVETGEWLEALPQDTRLLNRIQSEQ
jgi:gamma-glutamylcyclotransferase (GGCT)/AIG2-like uncharacterized protein YtfP